MTVAIVQGALELGVIYALVAMALFLSYSILDIADLTTDGCFTLGCAVSATVAIAGHPVLAIFAAIASGVAAGFVTAFLQTRLGVPSILAGIITNTGLYTINLAAMGFTSNLSLFKCETIFTMAKDTIGNIPVIGNWYKLILSALIVFIVAVLLILFLGTRLGMSIRATGDNKDMVRASSINPIFTITVGLCIANAMTALSGAILGQYQKSCDINLGTGMVVIGLASLIIGETLVGKKSMVRWVCAVITGSVIYRFIVAIALRFNVPAEALKLVSAIIVAIAIAMPAVKKGIAFRKRKNAAIRARKMGGGQ
ncbi:MAG: ABC transporter permease [Eubacterium sp.]